jgi:uncharacterized protein (TIGR03067 family)
MKLHVGLGLVACLFLVAAEEKAKKAADDTFKGVWKISTLSFGGAEQEDWKGYKFTFKGDKLMAQRPDGDQTYTFKVDSSKKPAEIDLIPEEGENKGKASKGIYQVKDGELKMCIPISPDVDRPKEFASKEGEQVALIVFKREKS